ncbi:MAG: helix-turn-helix domain-containing protein, partial [Synergistaceae bacterium]|nr:helix-turn-helix domain-containing protein [Synergistaceae bacterium]
MTAVMGISCQKSDFWYARVDIPVIKDAKLSPCDKAAYAVFCAHANVKTRETPISVKTLADETGCGIRTAQKSIKALIERGVLERKEQYEDGRQTTSLYRLIGHNALCYRNPGVVEESLPALLENPVDVLTVPEGGDEPCGAILAEAAANDVSGGAESEEAAKKSVSVGVKSAGYAENDTPEGAGFAHRYLEPIFNENQNISPLTPQGEGSGEGVGFESEGKKPFGTQETAEKSKAQRREFYDAVLDAYHTILPELPRSERLTDSGAVLIESRIGEAPRRGSIDWWVQYFHRVREFQWPMGENDKGWKANFYWLLSAKGMEKI